MIGNDVVDLRLAAQQSNWQRRGFLEKLFTKKEQEAIRRVSYPEQWVWLFWSMKEATYKAHQRYHRLKSRYNPKEFECRLKSFSSTGKILGSVEIQEQIYPCFSEIKEDSISTFAKKFEHVELYSVSTRPELLRRNCIFKIAAQHNIPPDSVEIKKGNDGIPHLFRKGENLQIPFSLSHHGRFAAFAF